MNKSLIAEEIFKALSLYPTIKIEKSKFVSDIASLPEDSLLFLYQGAIELEDLR